MRRFSSTLLLILLFQGSSASVLAMETPESLRKKAIGGPGPAGGRDQRARPEGAGRGAARPLGHPAHLRQECRRPVLRPGLRRRPGPPLPDRPVAAHGRRRDGRGGRQVRPGGRPLRPAAEVSRRPGRGVGQLFARRPPHRDRLHARHQRLHRLTSATACRSSSSSSASGRGSGSPRTASAGCRASS